MKISTVFTPRNPEVNLKMYIPRSRLEEALLESVQGTMHSLLFGESGNGKSWLYKKVFNESKIPFEVANCANASRKKSLTAEICSVLFPKDLAQKTGYSEKKEASATVGFAGGKLEHQAQYSVHSPDPMLQAFEHFRARCEGKLGVLVIDNLESIFKHSDLMDELADLIIMLDDPRFAANNIKLLVVGVPNGVLDYFAKTKNMESVANRLEELPIVGNLNKSMVRSLVSRGFNEWLKYDFSSEKVNEISEHVHHVTMGVAQRVHEYCAKYASNFEGVGRKLIPELQKRSDAQWLNVGLRACYTVIESHLNNKRTTIARKNQVIYCIGHLEEHQFDANRIRESVLEYFPATARENGMGIRAILEDLASGENPLLGRNPRTNEFRVADPRYLMCIRVALWRDPENQSVTKALFEV